jgi:GTP-binding protein YchF
MPSFALIGPPGSGKSTVFELVAGIAASRQALKQNFTADRAMVPVPDQRFEKLCALFNPKKRAPVSVEILDIPGVDAKTDVKLRTVAMTEVKKADGIAIVLNLFLPGAQETALAALREVWDELVFADYAVAQKGIENVENAARSKQNSDAEKRLNFLQSLIPHLEGGAGLRTVAFDEESEKLVRQYGLLTRKPILVIANLGEDALAEGTKAPGVEALHAFCEERTWPLFPLSAKVEFEIGQLDPEDRKELLASYQLDEPGLHRFVRAAYAALDLITFFTVGEDEVRGWTVRRSTPARRAAGAIHSDLERGFIRAEVIDQGLLLELGSMAEAKKRGVLRLEGKDYPVQDGDIFHVRFSV